MHEEMRRETALLNTYLGVEAALFVLIKAAELTLPAALGRAVKYAAIVVNTLMALWIYRTYGRANPKNWENLLALGLVTTCAADLFLTFISGLAMFVPGVALFCAMETVYAVYLKPGRGNLAGRAVLFVLLMIAAWRLGVLSVGIALGVLNLSMLALNLSAAWGDFRRDRDRTSLLFAVGLTCFLICDICVGLETLLPEGTAGQRAAVLVVWTVYVPAQVCIVLTYYRRVRAESHALPVN